MGMGRNIAGPSGLLAIETSTGSLLRSSHLFYLGKQASSFPNTLLEEDGHVFATDSPSALRPQIPYSEHSSFNELHDFVSWLQPAEIVPSVNNDQVCPCA